MKIFLTILNFLTLSTGSFGQSVNSSDIVPGGYVNEILHLITNGTVEHIAGCKSHDNFTKDDIEYILFTRNNKSGIALTLDNLCELDSTKDVKIIFEGWIATSDDPITLRIVNAYLTRYDCNVIFPKYTKLTNTEYTQAYCNIIKGAEMIGDFLCEMHCEGYLDFNRVHMTGLSIGAHFAGLVGQRVQKKCNQTVDRITGLDPAGPIYQGQDISKRLDKSDANFVDVIHTNMGMMGYYGSMGHVDFFPNYGSIQPGCIHSDTLRLSDILGTIFLFIDCNHSRSAQLFIESIYGPVFNSKSCDLCTNKKGIGKCQVADVINSKHAIMGEDCPRNPPAKRFYLKTNSQSPYAKA